MWIKRIAIAAVLVVGAVLALFFYQQQGADEKLTFVTEHYPPFAYLTDGGEVTGLSVDIVKEVMKRLGIHENISLGLWSDAYELATSQKNVVIFSLRRTEGRESLFNWVGPIARTKNIFYAQKGSGLHFDFLEEVKSVPRVGVIAEWFNAQNLKSAGFENLVEVETPEALVRSLMDGEVDVIAMTDISLVEYLEESGYTLDDVEQVLWIDGGYDYIGISMGTDESIVQKWRDAVADMKVDGTFEAIHEKYRPGSDLVDLLKL